MKNKPQTNLRKLREALGWTQDGLGKRASIQSAAICHYECGERAPSLQNLRKLKKALRCTWDELLG